MVVCMDKMNRFITAFLPHLQTLPAPSIWVNRIPPWEDVISDEVSSSNPWYQLRIIPLLREHNQQALPFPLCLATLRTLTNSPEMSHVTNFCEMAFSS